METAGCYAAGSSAAHCGAVGDAHAHLTAQNFHFQEGTLEKLGARYTVIPVLEWSLLPCNFFCFCFCKFSNLQKSCKINTVDAVKSY